MSVFNLPVGYLVYFSWYLRIEIKSSMVSFVVFRLAHPSNVTGLSFNELRQVIVLSHAHLDLIIVIDLNRHVQSHTQC